MPRAIYFDGRAVKSTPLKDIEQWIIAEDADRADISPALAYKAVSWVRRCVELRADALSGMPFAVLQGDKRIELPAFISNLPALLALAEMSLCTYGAEYWFKQSNKIGGALSYRHLAATSIDPQYDKEHGLTGFKRRVGGETKELPLEQAAWFWERNFLTEIGPGTPLAETALSAAGIGYNANIYTSGFFKRGAVPGVLLVVDDDALQEDLDRLEAWWRRLLRGARRAWETVAIRSAVKPVVVGKGPGRALGMEEIYANVRRQVAVTFGVPQTLLEDAANYATAKEHRLSFYQETIIPRAKMYEGELNRQVFEPEGLRFEFKPQELELFQQDEATKAEALVGLVGVGIMTVDEARMQLGIEAPGAGPAKGAGVSYAAWGDLQRWRKKAARRFAEGRPIDALDFESAVIPAPIKRLVTMGLERSLTAADAEAVFDSMAGEHGHDHESKRMRIIPDGAEDPLPAIPAEITFSDAEIARAMKRWDQLMPEYKGMLDAELEDRIEYDGQEY